MRKSLRGALYSFMGRALTKTVLICSCLMVSGCWSVGTDFSNLKLSILEPFTSQESQDKQFINAHLAPTEAQDSEDPSMQGWWQSVNDPLLNDYVDTLLQQNLSLTQAGERVIQARESLTSARAERIPSLSAQTQNGRSFAPGGAFTPTSSNNTRFFNDTLTASLQASWQTDLFGKLRRNQEAAAARLDATSYERDALAHSLVADLFNQRVSITVLDKQRTLAQQLEDNRAQLFKLQQRRYQNGVRGTVLSDVYDAETGLDSAKASLHDREIALTSAHYALDILLGETPGTLEPTQQDFPLTARPATLPACMAASLLDRRPDLQAQRALLKAANADVSVAIADLYPTISLDAAIGFDADTTNSFFNARNLTGSILSTLGLRLYEGGALRSNIRGQEAKLREQAAAYAEAILTALSNVEENLKTEHELTRKLDILATQLGTAEKTERLEDDRYRKGISNLANLLNAQQQTLQQKSALLDTQQALWQARVRLYLSLGGDWLGHNQAASTCQNNNAAQTQETVS